MEEPEEIPQRDLRNKVSEILREVSNGRRFRITVRGKPVADLVPVERPTFVPWSVIERIIREHPLDANFKRDTEDLFSLTIDDLTF